MLFNIYSDLYTTERRVVFYFNIPICMRSVLRNRTQLSVLMSLEYALAHILYIKITV